MAIYRNSMQITGSILQAVQDKDRNGAPITVIMQKANIAHPRLVKFISNLTHNGLMNKVEHDGKHTYIITDKGIEYLTHYRKFESMAQSFGLEL